MIPQPPEFKSFQKITRFSRNAVITEKIDGTNALIRITPEGQFFTGSRNRWITPEDDNAGFAKWAHEHKDELMTLGVGSHYGEWWGKGIQRNYGLKEKRFSLFNVHRWCLHGTEPKDIPTGDPKITRRQQVLPACVGLVPVLWEGPFDEMPIGGILFDLEVVGSIAAPGFMQPEGIVIAHIQGGLLFKKTLEGDGVPKSLFKPEAVPTTHDKPECRNKVLVANYERQRGQTSGQTSGTCPETGLLVMDCSCRRCNLFKAHGGISPRRTQSVIP